MAERASTVAMMGAARSEQTTLAEAMPRFHKRPPVADARTRLVHSVPMR